MKRNLIDASQLELEDKVVSIKRVTKVVKEMCIRDRLTESRREQAISPSCWMKDKEEKHGTES